MKKILLLSLLSICNLMLHAQTVDTPSGHGTSDDPYQISTLNNLYWLSQTSSAWGAYFIQTANIDASTTSTWDSGSGFSPIGNETTPFSGTYYGNGHTISGLIISRSSTNNVGLFGYTSSTIDGLGLIGGSVSGSSSVGSLIGLVNSGTISNCYATGSVNGITYVGGLIGDIDVIGTNITLSNCYATGNVNGTNMVGGLVGYIYEGTINNCYATGNVTGATSVGGLLGWSESASVFNNCYAIGNMTGTSGVGGLVGDENESSGTFTNCFYNSELFTGTTTFGTGKTTSEMKTESTFTGAGWDFAGETTNGINNYWVIDATQNNGYPILVHKPKVTTTAISLFDATTATMGGTVTAEGSTTVSARGVVYSSTNTTPTIGGTGVTTDENGTGTGSFSKSISGLTAITTYYVRAYATNSIGTSYGDVTNFTTKPTSTAPTIGDGTSSSPYQIATLENLYWFSQTSSVWGSYFVQTADIDASTTSTWSVGFPPIANGSNFTGNYNGQGYVISQLYMNKSSDHTGLFFCPQNATITNLGLVNCSIHGISEVGALASATFGSTQITNCFVTGTVVGTGYYVGGFVGLNQGGPISNCYLVGIVSGGNHVGGIVGEGSSSLTNCYVSATISGNSSYPQYTGGIYGHISGGSVNNCFYNSDSFTGSTSYGTGKTAAELKTQSTFTNAGWDFIGETTNGNNDIWAISTGINSGYPCFTRQGTLTAPTVTTQAVSDITGATAMGNGSITDLGFPNPTSYGVCWNTAGTPTLSDSKVDNGAISATGAFTAPITGLSIGTTYHVRAYATNAKGTSYGDEVTFTTNCISTSAVTNITNSSATLNGIINANNITSTVTFEYGISTSFGTSVNATPNTVSGNSATTVSYALSGLTSNTVYYIRAVATNSGGTVYGNTISFSTELIGGDGSSTNPYQIATLNELKWLSENSSSWNGYIIQTADIDASETSTWNSGSGFSPIGNSTTNFTGHYNGKGHTISGLTISRSSIDYIGLFGYIGSSATVDSIGVGIDNITGHNYVGGLAGYNTGTVRFCYTTGVVSGSLGVGGFIGFNSGGAVSYSHSSVATTGNYDVAAFIGDNVNSSSINYCYATGNSIGSTVSGCYTSGGLVGWNEKSGISNCYATGNVIGIAPVGGLVGDNGGSGTVSNSYAVGTVTGTNPGGLAGHSSGSITSSFYNNEIFTDATSYGTGKTTAEMKAQSTFTNAGWNFNSIWAIGTGSYPVLRCQLSTVTWNGSWTPNTPTNMDMVIINSNYNDSGFSCYDLTVNAEKQLTISSGNLTVAGNLTLKSDATGTASMIYNGGAVSVTGTTTIERYMTADAWHLITPPVSGQTIGTFLTANTTIKSNPDNSSQKALKDYNESTNTWNGLTYTTGTTDLLSLGKGYAVWPSSAGVVSFTGTLPTGNQTVTVARTGDYGWNCIGNPYASSIAINANTAAGTSCFINANSDNMETSFWAIYVWDQTQSKYLTFNQSDAAYYLPVDQAFFVKAKTGATQISFTSAMQQHQPGATFRSATAEKPEIDIDATMNGKHSTAKVRFTEKATKGLDFGYDAGAFKTGFDVYTKLVEDNGVDFAIQSLPTDPGNGYVIPVGLETSESGTVELSLTP
ncbi:MAG: GLUG motif-containing protein, partial [Bacteroidales bacterium]|nr:GLUG motif-containing protein [Bacteroidales bacterium]